MRRIDGDNHVRHSTIASLPPSPAAPPFRVLAAPADSYYVPSVAISSPSSPSPTHLPPPPRAPEPYKIAPSTIAIGANRAHRRSSFVIIAEARPATPDSPNSSPTLAPGRISPFRGRGFRGAPPRPRSRPESPDEDVKDGRIKRGRPERRASISQQDGSKRSLIPQPTTRRRSVSLTKNDRPSSPKIGRRTINNSRNELTKRNSKSMSRLSPIQGTPTKQEPIKGKDRSSSSSSLLHGKTNKNFISSNRTNVNNNVRNKQSREKLTSPSKIPLKNASFKKSDSTTSLNKRFIEDKTTTSQKQTYNENNQKRFIQNVKKDQTRGTKTKENNHSNEKDKEQDKPPVNLMNLLKQSSAATGTSSVVNATTTTAVQPLQINATNNDENLTVKSSDEDSPVVVVVAKHKKTVEEKPPSTVEDKSFTTNLVIEDVNNITGDTNQDDVVTMKTEREESKNELRSVASENKIQRPDDDYNRVNSSNPSLKSYTKVSSGSIESVGSDDTGVSVDTVKGVSSPRVKEGVHMVERSQEIETLSGNVVHFEKNGEPTVLNEPRTDATTTTTTTTANEDHHPVPDDQKSSNVPEDKFLTRWKRSIGHYCGRCASGMRCLACRRDSKGFLWGRKTSRMESLESSPARPQETVPPSSWTRFKNRCSRFWEMKWCSKKGRIAPTGTETPCCPPERRFGPMCRRVFMCCGKCKCKGGNKDGGRTTNVRAKPSLTSVASPPPVQEDPKSKLPDVLVEHNSVMHGAIPCLPVPLAWFCLVCNVLLPGSGTIFSGVFNLCLGQPRFSPTATLNSRLGAFIVNLIIGISQLFTVIFCLVGWGWSLWWGITMIRLAKKWKRFKNSEVANGDPEARAGVSPGGGPLPPGVPSQALREVERTR